MEAIKQINKVPLNHEIKIKIPSYISENEIVETILIFKNTRDINKHSQKIKELKECSKDELFLNDIKEISEDFEAVDLEQ